MILPLSFNPLRPYPPLAERLPAPAVIGVTTTVNVGVAPSPYPAHAASSLPAPPSAILGISG